MGLCEAEIMTPRSTEDEAVRWATVGVVTTPTRTTSIPALARPAASAWSRNSPEIRVSRPMMAFGLCPEAGRPEIVRRAAASPSSSARGAVKSTFASPRTPSVPNNLVIGVPPARKSIHRYSSCSLFTQSIDQQATLQESKQRSRHSEYKRCGPNLPIGATP